MNNNDLQNFLKGFKPDAHNWFARPFSITDIEYELSIFPRIELSCGILIVGVSFKNSKCIPKNIFKYPKWFVDKFPNKHPLYFHQIPAIDVYNLYNELNQSQSQVSINSGGNCYHCNIFDGFAAPSKKTGKLVCYKCCDRY